MTNSRTTIEALLAGRRYEDLTDDEKLTYRLLHEEEAVRGARAIADNLNKNVLAKD